MMGTDTKSNRIPLICVVRGGPTHTAWARLVRRYPRKATSLVKSAIRELANTADADPDADAPTPDAGNVARELLYIGIPIAVAVALLALLAGGVTGS